jgi:transcription-repair coupling factor (superfamily II helicase)
MKIRDFVDHYTKDSLTQMLAQYLNTSTPERVQVKGLVGSLDSVMASATYKIHTDANQRINHIFVLHDRDEALYFYNDLQNLLGKKNIWFFPSSYKRPYKFMEVENANILERAEVLNRINQQISNPQVVSIDANKADEENPTNNEGFMIVTYPSALVEKVINKRSLLENTFTAEVGEKVDIEFLAEILHTYDFDKTDFVYEAGQFSIRGGIVDIFSYSNDYPYRLEFFDDELESIRLFDPESQLSVEQVNQIAIIPNVQTKLVQEVRESFLNFVPNNTKVWL